MGLLARVRAISDSRHMVAVWAAGRQGGNELGQALKAFPDSIQAPPEQGGIGTVTPGEVTEAKHPRKSQDRDGPEME